MEGAELLYRTAIHFSIRRFRHERCACVFKQIPLQGVCPVRMEVQMQR